MWVVINSCRQRKRMSKLKRSREFAHSVAGSRRERTSLHSQANKAFDNETINYLIYLECKAVLLLIVQAFFSHKYSLNTDNIFLRKVLTRRSLFIKQNVMICRLSAVMPFFYFVHDMLKFLKQFQLRFSQQRS